MILRPAEAGDAPGLCDLINPVIRNTAVTFTTEEKTTREIAAAIRDSGAYFVACDGTRILGYACYFPFRGGPGYRHTKEHSIALAAEARGRGVGRGLMALLEDHARAHQVHSLFAGVSGENPDGIAFHKAIGFAEVAWLPQVGHKFGRWMDLVLLQKMLSLSH
ncbi:GNAT family N-acetyltransferase [Marinovum sp.]|uniref:GNAT family N-acetyltransferase n=1 Tax=Marinovum sp. TaxID=2024839 RepID=UPI002B272BD0|nr:GNAT family N-acetyltransferase [Marinovum sp.]